jgi:hypothetical protein
MVDKDFWVGNNTTKKVDRDFWVGKEEKTLSKPLPTAQTKIEQGANPKDAYKGMLVNPNTSTTLAAQPQTGEQFLQQLNTKMQMSNERAMPQIQKKYETQRLEEEKAKLEKEINTQKAYMAANDKAYKDLTASGLYSNVAQNSLAQRTNAENKVAELQKQLDDINTKIKVNTIDEETKKYTDTNKDTFFGRSETNFDINTLQQKLAYANNDYLDNPTENNKKIAEAYRKAIQEAYENNPNTAGKGGWLDKSLAGYLPQLGNQLKAGGLGGATGAVVAGGLTAAGTALLPTVGEEVLIPKATMWGFNLGSAGSSAADTYTIKGVLTFAYYENVIVTLDVTYTYPSGIADNNIVKKGTYTLSLNAAGSATFRTDDPALLQAINCTNYSNTTQEQITVKSVTGTVILFQ